MFLCQNGIWRKQAFSPLKGTFSLAYFSLERVSCFSVFYGRSDFYGYIVISSTKKPLAGNQRLF
jgi:hypothetical protein